MPRKKLASSVLRTTFRLRTSRRDNGSRTTTLSVFPVPDSNELRLQLPDNATVVSASIFDLRGARVAAARYAGDGRIDVSMLASGSYLVQCFDGVTTYRQRFVKQ